MREFYPIVFLYFYVFSSLQYTTYVFHQLELIYYSVYIFIPANVISYHH